MPMFVSYRFRVEGRLAGPKSSNGTAISLFLKIFATKPTPPPASGPPWPYGFLPEGFTLAGWLADASDADGAHGNETVLSFFAMRTAVRPGKLADKENASFVAQHHDFVLAYRKSGWYAGLKQQLMDLAAEFDKLGVKVLVPVWPTHQETSDCDGSDS